MHFLLVILAAAMVLSSSPSSASADMTPAFGPKTYTRAQGRPQIFTERFQHCGTAACQLVIVNGNADGSQRISGASISLNGVEIAGPSDFNQQVARIVKPVVLAANDTLVIQLASRPGGFLIIGVECAASPVVLVAGEVGNSLLNPTTLLTALPILNTGTATAQNVKANAIAVTGGTLSSPTPLPFGLGVIPGGGESAVLNANFSGTFAPAGLESMTVSGTYTVGGAEFCFALSRDFIIPPAAPGSAPFQEVIVPSNTVSGGGFPHEEPELDDEVNTPRWTVPVAPFVAGTPTPTPTLVNVAPAVTTLPGTNAALLAPSSIVFTANRSVGIPKAGQNCSGDPSAVCAEPSGASTENGVVFVSANFSAAWSANGGATFNQIDPTTIFPSNVIDFCCDQIVQYVRSIDRFVWLLQGKTRPGYRLAVASPASIIASNGTAWTYWNLTPGVFGHQGSFDFPDVSFGETYLYVSWNAGGCDPCDWGRQVARIPLAQLAAGGSIGIGYTHPNDGRLAWGSHLSQNSFNAAFWAGLIDSAHIRVFSAKDSENVYSWHDTGIASSTTNGYSSLTPDGLDWMGQLNDFPKGAVLGATASGNQLWFAWSAAADQNFQRPYVQMVALDRNNFHLLQQVQIWNNDYAFGYPALATNACTGEVGLSLEFGGNGHYENHVVGIWGDYVLYQTTASNIGTNRYGDYVTIRQAPSTVANPGNLFDAFGYGYGATRVGVTIPQTDVRYVVFGRPVSSCPIFE